MPLLEDKKKGPAAKALAKSKVTSGRAANWDMPTFAAPGEVTSVNPGVVLGLEASTLDNPTMAKKLLQGIVLPVDKETVNKLDLDMETTWFLHALIQMVTYIRSMYVLVHL